jgi:hypothetical protein
MASVQEYGMEARGTKLHNAWSTGGDRATNILPSIFNGIFWRNVTTVVSRRYEMNNWRFMCEVGYGYHKYFLVE